MMTGMSSKVGTAFDLAAGLHAILLRHEDVHQDEIDLMRWRIAAQVEQQRSGFRRIGAQDIVMAGFA